MIWKNGVAYGQRNVEMARQPVDDIASVYIDDLLVGTVQEQTHSVRDMLLQHDRDIRGTLCALWAAKLVALGPKCSFFCEGSGMVRECYERRDPQPNAWQVESSREVGVSTNGNRTLLFSGVLQFLLRLSARFFSDGFNFVRKVKSWSSGWGKSFQVSTDLVR